MILQIKLKLQLRRICQHVVVLTCRLRIEAINLKSNKLIINYNLPEYNSDNLHLCEVICRPYLLIMIKKENFTSIDFYENGILVKSIDK